MKHSGINLRRHAGKLLRLLPTPRHVAGLLFAPVVAAFPVFAQPALTGAGEQGTVNLRMLSCCRASYFGPAVSAWDAHNPRLPITQEVVPFAQLTDIMESRLRSHDSSFDVMIVDPPRTASLAARGFLVDLTPTLGPIGAKTINPESLAGTTYRGKLYAAPVFNSTQVSIIPSFRMSEQCAEPGWL